MFRGTWIALVVSGVCLAQDPPARLDQVVQSYVTSKQFMGSVLVAKDKTILLDKGYGFANLESGHPEYSHHEVPPRIGHQAIHGGFHPAPRRTREIED